MGQLATQIPEDVLTAAATAVSVHVEHCDYGNTWRDCHTCRRAYEQAEAALKSAMQPLVEQAAAQERARIAAHFRSVPADDGPLHSGVRRFIDRHRRLRDGSSVVAVLLAVADEIDAGWK